MKELNKYLIEKLSLTNKTKFFKNFKFGGLNISTGPVYYDGSNFKISNSWKDNEYSYKKIHGLEKESFYFNWDQCHDINIDDYRLPTKDELNKIINGKRKGSIVNGNEGVRYALIQLKGLTYCDYSTPNGILLFPDNRTMEGIKLSGINNETQTTGVTEEELNEYLEQGCVFMPCGGYYYDYIHHIFDYGGSYGYYWSSTENNRNLSIAYTLEFSARDVDLNNAHGKDDTYLPIFLVRKIN